MRTREFISQTRHAFDRCPVACIAVIIKSYQLLIAPLLIGGGCRHQPTCSQYALQAFERHGLRRGFTLTAIRIWHCRPGGSYGYDPVP